jgi:hypothetical protein
MGLHVLHGFETSTTIDQIHSTRIHCKLCCLSLRSLSHMNNWLHAHKSLLNKHNHTYLQPLPNIYFPEVSRHLGHDAPYLLMSLALTNAPSSIHFIYIYITMVLKNPNMVITCLWESSIRSSILSFFLWTWWCWWYHQNHQPFLIESIAWMGWPLAKLALVFNGHIFLGVLAPLSYYSACRERYVAGMWGRRDQKQ